MPDSTNLNTSGETVAELAFKQKVSGDCVDDRTMMELVRRLEATFTQTVTSDIWPGATPPEDKSLIWWPKDPTSGTRIGQPKIYDAVLKEWVPLTGSLTAPTALRARRNGQNAVAAGDSVVNLDFDSLETTNYFPSITLMSPSTPGNMANTAFTVISRSNAQCVVAFFGIPAAGATALWTMEANSL